MRRDGWVWALMLPIAPCGLSLGYDLHSSHKQSDLSYVVSAASTSFTTRQDNIHAEPTDHDQS